MGKRWGSGPHMVLKLAGYPDGLENAKARVSPLAEATSHEDHGNRVAQAGPSSVLSDKLLLTV